jgi:uncharacterized membrane protein YdjX (TVP38/TMEM64 family)
MNKWGLVKNLLILVVSFAVPIWINRTFLHISPEMIRDWILSWGLLAPIIFIILFIARAFILFPSPIIAIASGLTFGFWYGLLFTFIGTNLSAIATFIAVRTLGSKVVKKSWDEKYNFAKKQINDRGFIYLLILRLLPFINFDIVSYAASFSSVKFRDYVWATCIGVIPGTIIYTSIGSSVHSEESSSLIISISFLVILMLLPVLFHRQIKQWMSPTKN